MNGQTALSTTVNNQNTTSIPTYAIVILAVGIAIIVAVVLFILLRKYRRYEQRMAKQRSKNSGMQDIINERRRLLAD